MTDPYCYPGPRRLAVALKLMGFSDVDKLSKYGSGLRTMLGIAYAESSGNAFCRGENKNAIGVVTSVDHGVWQINDRYEGDTLLRTRAGYTTQTDQQLRSEFGADPRNTFYYYQRLSGRSWSNWVDNARMAYATWKAKGLKSWVTYTAGALDDPSRVNWPAIDRGIAEAAIYDTVIRWTSVYLETP